MFKTLLIKEIQNYLYSLRFQFSFVIVIIVFLSGTISFIPSYKQASENLMKYQNEVQAQRERMAKNATLVAINRNTYYISLLNNAFISNCSEQFLPNKIQYSAYNVFDFKVSHNNVNPLMKSGRDLNWAFIVSVVLSFIALLLSYDSISGEKEERTISLIFTNSVSRGIIILSKLAGVVIVVSSMALIGMIISLLILTMVSIVPLSGAFFAEIGAFLLISILLITLMTSCGLLASVLSRSSNVSLLISLCIWLFFVVVIPNTAVFWANKVFPIAHADEIQKRISTDREMLNKNAPEGSWSSNDGEPFYPRHELRANLQTKLLMASKKHKDEYYSDMFRQFESTRELLMISPLAQFDIMNEAILASGYMRFNKNWKDIHVFQEQFLSWFKSLDIKDPKSPHWYNPYENLSTTRQAVAIDQIPIYQEKYEPWKNRIHAIVPYLMIMLLYNLIVISAVLVMFQKYDVR